jgi:hypothetical protein
VRLSKEQKVALWSAIEEYPSSHKNVTGCDLLGGTYPTYPIAALGYQYGVK